MIPHTPHKYIFFVGLIMLLSIPCGTISMGRNLQQLTEEQIRNLIDAKIQEKINAVNQRYELISNITLAENQAKSLRSSLIDAKVAAQAAYRTYYYTKMKCDGYTASSTMIGVKGEISDEICLQFPIALESLSLYTLKNQLEGYLLDSQIAEKAYNIQNDFLIDAGAELAIYQDLKTFFTTKNNVNLSQKYGNQVTTSTNFYNTEKMIRDAKKQESDRAKQIQASASLNAQKLESQLKILVDSCNADLTGIKTDLNEKLALAAELENKILQKQQIVSQGFNETATKLIQLKRITAELKALAEQYAVIVAVA